ncbi:hypothetical protein ON010_g18256 [Phytophthora cinnamomi]|nr:hypothetical protein ON010_g18256 [Phytophthora cinnamomi]
MVLRAVDQSATLVHHEKLRQYRQAMYLVPSKMAVEKGALEAMQQLHARYPDCVDSTMVEAVGKMADLSTLKWLHTCCPSLFMKFDWFEGCVFDSASLKGQVDVVGWLVKLFPSQVRSITSASREGHLNIVRWLIKNSNWDELVGDAFVVAVGSGQLKTAQFLHEKYKPNSLYISANVASEDDNDMIRWLNNTAHKYKYSAVDAAASGGHLDMIQWLHVNYPNCFSTRTMDCAARNGQLEVVKFLHANRPEGCTTNAMNGAAANGHFDMVQWLHQHRREGCTTDAIDSCSHMKILKWLNASRREGCTSKAMGKAMMMKRFDIAKWLHDHQGLQYPDNIVDELAQAGNLQVLTWLHKRKEGKWSKNAMNEAASSGHLDVVKYLHENRREGCSRQAMNNAAGNNYLDVVEWLHANRREGCSVLAMTNAATGGHLEMVQWLHAHRREGCSPAAMSGAAAGGHIRVMEFLVANYSMNDNIGALEFILTHAADCITKTVYFTGIGNDHPEVVKWYEDHYGNPRKRKTPPA